MRVSSPLLLIALTLTGGCSLQTSDLEAKDTACRQTIGDYSYFVDLGKPERVAELFTEDGRWALGPQVIEGNAAITGYFEGIGQQESRVSRHVLSNVRIVWQSATEATATMYVTLYRGQSVAGGIAPMAGQPFFVGHYQDRYQYSEGRCLIQERIIIPAFLTAAAP